MMFRNDLDELLAFEERARAEALDQLKSLIGNGGKATTETAELVKGARYGRIDRLFLSDRSQLPTGRPPQSCAAEGALCVTELLLPNPENAMDIPVEIVFHNMPSSARIETEIRKRVDKLDRLYEHLTGCRVSVEQLHRRHHTGNLYDVHIDMRVPGDEIVVSRELHHAREKFADPDIGIAVRNAFKAAERRLLDYKHRQRGEVKVHAEAFAGQVALLNPEEDHGFILTHEGSQLYFHRNSLIHRDFDRLKTGDKVHFVETDGDTGPTAGKVWRVEGEPG